MEWLKRIIRSAFEDSVKSIISTLIIMGCSYGATLLWQNVISPYLYPNKTVKITTVSLQQGRIGEYYNSLLSAEVDGIEKKVDWSIASLPTGLYLNEETIEGKPQIAGQYKITVIATDGNISDSRDLSLVIKEKSVSTVSPSPTNTEPINIKPNEEFINTQSGQNIYRIHLPSRGRIALQWQTGERESSKEIYTASLHKNEQNDETVADYSMTSTPSYKISNPIFVSSGDYYLTLSPKTSKVIPCSIMLQFESMEYIEIEENDTFSSATLIDNNVAYSGNLKDKNDIDYYCFKIIDSNAVNVTINTNGYGVDTAIYTLTVYDANRNKLTETTANGKISLSETGNLYLRAGTYYVGIKQGNTWRGETYALTIKTLKKDFMEAERNDTADTANIIPINGDIHASIIREDDVDYFSFILEKTANVTPCFDFKPLASDLKIYNLSITEDYGKEITKFEFRGKGQPSKAVKPTRLEAGTYIAKVSRIKRNELPFALHEYVLRINAQ